MSTRSITLKAHAKLNLALAVDRPAAEGPRAGMHPIASWMVPITLADPLIVERLEFGEASEFDITRADGTPVEWPVESDLVFRAHAALEKHSGRTLPTRVVVRKHIPAGGGLGGGSSDAAAVMRAMVHLHHLQEDVQNLHPIAAALGSDIPFFLPDESGTPPGAAFVTGLGEQIERVPPVRWGGPGEPEIPVLLIVPPFGCPTGAVYQAFDQSSRDGFRRDDVERLARGGVVTTGELFNDLASPAERVRPALGTIRAGLAEALGTPVHVSGSGSTLFCLGVKAEEAEPFLPEGCVALDSSVLSSTS